MDTIQGNPFEVLAAGFCYPDSEHLAFLHEGADFLPAGAAKKAFLSFLLRIGALPLSDWEELHTRTLDLNPTAAPYFGFQTWGESYQRGAFLAALNHELTAADVDTEGELPDHLIPVLRYLGRAQSPLPELVEILEPVMARLISVLHKSDPDNPYLDLFHAVQALISSTQKETA